MDICYDRLKYTVEDLRETVLKYFGVSSDDVAKYYYLACNYQLRLSQIDGWCLRLFPHVPYLIAKFEGRKRIDFLSIAFKVFHIEEAEIHIDIELDEAVNEIKDKLFRQSGQTNVDFDDSVHGGLKLHIRRLKKEKLYNFDFYNKRTYARDNFDALTDGQMGSYDDYDFGEPDVDSYMGR